MIGDVRTPVPKSGMIVWPNMHPTPRTAVWVHEISAWAVTGDASIYPSGDALEKQYGDQWMVHPQQKKLELVRDIVERHRNAPSPITASAIAGYTALLDDLREALS